MTTEEKDIIYKDACCRLPYHPYAAYTLDDGTTVQAQLTGADDGQYYGYILDTWGYIPSLDIKLYLRPLSSMTEEEKEEYSKLTQALIEEDDKVEYLIRLPNYNTLDWLNAHYLDYRDLIGKGLALPAPEGMYV